VGNGELILKDNIYYMEDKAIQRSDFSVWVTLDELKLDMEDSELKDIIKKWMSIATKSEQILKTNADVNKNYYIGIDSRSEDIMDDKSKVADNRIFTDIETIVPIVTSRPAKPVVTIIQANTKWEKGKNQRSQSIKIQNILTAIYQDQKLQHKYEKLIRQHQIWRIGMLKYGIKDDKIFADVKLPSRLLLDSEATCMEDSEFVWEKIVDTASYLANKYPDKESQISSKVSGKMWTKLTYIEWWTDDMKLVSIGSELILEAIKNPLFDYEGVKEEKFDENGEILEGEPTTHNFFERPRKPFISFNVYNIGENIIDDTTCLELSKTLQDNINDRKRQISDNADATGNPIRVYEWFSSDQASEADANLEAWDGVNLWEGQSISYVQAQPLPSHIQNDLQDSRNAIDNIFGIHSTTRWERQGWANESGRAREALREWDEDRQATLWRAIEQVSEELYNWFTHLIKVFYGKEETLPILWGEDSAEYVKFKREDILDGLRVKVKPWSTVPEDPNALKAQAIELAQLGKISDKRLYEMLGMEDVDEAVQELQTQAAEIEKKNQEILQAEQNEVANQETKNGFEEQINQIWQNPQVQ